MRFLKFDYITGSDVVQLGHLRFQIIILLSAGAVASVVGSTVFIKNLSRFIQGCCVFALSGEAEEVEATNQDVGLEPFHNVEDTLVRATADYNALTVFFNNKVLRL